MSLPTFPLPMQPRQILLSSQTPGFRSSGHTQLSCAYAQACFPGLIATLLPPPRTEVGYGTLEAQWRNE